MVKQTIKTMGELPQFQAVRDGVSQVAAILVAVEFGADSRMQLPDISAAIAGCNALLGNITERLDRLDSVEVNHV